MAPRDGDGSYIRRSVTSCASCLAWGLTHSQGVCLACYSFAAARFGHAVGVCGSCGRSVRLKKGHCRLCWVQAYLERPDGPNTPLAPHVKKVRHHQLFLAGLDRRVAAPKASPRRRGEKGRPRKPPPAAARPHQSWWQLPLFDDLVPREFGYGRFDLRAGPAPDNPWLAWALHLAHAAAETRGWDRWCAAGCSGHWSCCWPATPPAR